MIKNDFKKTDCFTSLNITGMLLALLFLIISCKKEEPTVENPPQRTTGSGSMEWKVNGVRYVAEKDTIYPWDTVNIGIGTPAPPLLECFATQGQTAFGIAGRRGMKVEGTKYYVVQLFILGSLSIRRFNTINEVGAVYSETHKLGNGDIVSYLFQTDSTHLSTVEITQYDSVGKTISGTFEFKSKKCLGIPPCIPADSVSITEGKFNALTIYKP